MRYWTGTGDKGHTGIFGGSKVSKSDLRIEVCGTIDELNSFVGLAKSASRNDIADSLENLQRKLLALGADLSAPAGTKTIRISSPDVSFLERTMDDYGKKLEDISYFILPGGSELSSRLHVCRAVCRRAERLAVKLSEREEVNGEAIKFLNRLSSLFFVLARSANKNANVKDVEWQK